MPLFRALAKNMAPMTNADESPTNRLTLFPIYLSLFTRIVRKRSVFFCAYACHWLCMSIHERIKYTFRYDTVQVENARLSLQPWVISIQQTI